MADDEQLVLRVPKAMKERLEKIAERQDRSVSYVVREFIESGLERTK